MAAGIGPLHTLDLDTPLLRATDSLEGGYRYEGPRMGIVPRTGIKTVGTS